jgi:FliI/YscN family ATPase
MRRLAEQCRRLNHPVAEGRVASMTGLAIEVVGLPSAAGDGCTILARDGPVEAEVVGFRSGRAVLMPFGETTGIAPGSIVHTDGRSIQVPVGRGLLGRVIDPLGRPLDGKGAISGPTRALLADAGSPMDRTPVDELLETGVSAIDGLISCGKGQRIGIFAGSGVGKSTLLGMVARKARADVNVIALIGERGREVKAFTEDVLGAEGMARSVIVVATSDAAPLLRLKGPSAAISVAEAFRDEGLDVLFVMDSVTRYALASREVGLAAGEPPTLRGYPPSLFAGLPRLLERLGRWEGGSITGILTVLVEGDDLNEPVSDALRGLLDGHIVLSRAFASRGRYPPIDALASLSRLMDKVATPDHQELARDIRAMMAVLEENRDLVQVGAYRRGVDPLLDFALAKADDLRRLLHPGTAHRTLTETLALMGAIRRRAQAGRME